MTQISPERLDGATVVGSDGDKIGKVQEIYLDDETRQPEWVTVKTGMLGSKSSFVPLAGAGLEGDDVQVPFDKAAVKDSPHFDDDGDLSTEQEAELFRYYNIPYTGETATAAGPPASGQATPPSDDVSADDAMTRSEEQLHVGTRTVETGKVRLRKRVVTENVTRTVPVSHEEVVIEREPVTEANRDQAMSGPDLTEDEASITLHSEQAVASKETVPVERVSLGTREVGEEQTIEESVSKEQIDIEDERR